MTPILTAFVIVAPPVPGGHPPFSSRTEVLLIYAPECPDTYATDNVA